MFFVIFLLLLAKTRASIGARHPPGSTRTSKKGTLPRSGWPATVERYVVQGTKAKEESR